jgi:DNA-directed RNA polymerase subunit RPC12/RpoP
MASFKFFCSHCGKKYSATDELRGSAFDCRSCNRTITVPEESATVPSPANPPAPRAEARDESGKIHLVKESCDQCGGPLDLLGECAACKARVAADEAKRPARPVRQGPATGIVGRMLKARVPGMQRVIPGPGGTPPSGPRKRR